MSFPNYIQLDTMDCGATCLQIIAKYYGKYITLQNLRELCHINRNGVSMLGISDASEAIGFRSLGVKITWEQLKEDATLPCIVHWNQGHFVVVHKIKKRKGTYIVCVSDPGSGLLEYTETSFLKSWLQICDNNDTKRGAALLLSPKPEFYNEEYNQNGGENHIKIFDLLKYLKPYKKHIVQIGIALLTASIISLIFPFLTQSVVDTGIGTGNVSFVVMILIAQLCLVLGQMTNNIIRSWLMLHVTTRISISLISDFLSKLMRLPIAFFDSKNVGDIMQRIKDYNKIETFLTGTLISTVMSVVTFVIYGIIMATYNSVIIIVFLIGSVL